MTVDFARCPASYPHTPEPHRWTLDTADGIERCVKCASRRPSQGRESWHERLIRLVRAKDYPAALALLRAPAPDADS